MRTLQLVGRRRCWASVNGGTSPAVHPGGGAMSRKSTGAYPPDWKAIATAVKDEAGWHCVRCGHPHNPEAGYTLTVHHLDIDPSNCRWWNLAALCQRCHLSIQGRVHMDRPWVMGDHSEWFRP